MNALLVGTLLVAALLISGCADDDQAEQGTQAQPTEQILTWEEQLTELLESYAHLVARWDALVELALPSGASISSDRVRINEDVPLQLADFLDRRPTPSDEELAELTSSFDSLYAESKQMYAEARGVITNATNLSESERGQAQQILEEFTQAERGLDELATLLQHWQEANAYTSKDPP